MNDYGHYQSIEEYNLKKPHPTYRYIMLVILFLVCSIAMGWMIGDLAVHMRTGDAIQVADHDCIMLTVKPPILKCK